MGRKPCCSREGLKKGAWTELEDKILRDYIKLHGQGNWNNIPKLAGLKRCGKSCRLRWVNYLRPDIKRGNISSEEEDLIIRMHKLLGNRWSLIAGRLPNRTDNEIKNYWNTILRKQLEPQLSSKVGRINRKLTDEGPKQSLEPKKYVESTLQAMPLPVQPIRPKAFRLISKIHTSSGSDDEECKDSNEEMKIDHQSTIDEAPTQPEADLNTVDSCYSIDVPQINDNTIGTTSTDHDHSSPIIDEQGLENWNNCYDSIFTEFIATTVEDDLGVSDFESLATFLGLD